MLQQENKNQIANPRKPDALSIPHIDVGEHVDVADKFLESIKSVYDSASRKLSEKGIKPKLPSTIRLQELPGKIGFEKYLKQENGKLYIFVVPNVQKVFGYYNPVTDEAVIDPILLKDTEFSKLMKEYGLKMKQPNLKEVLAEETIVHKLQKDAGALDRGMNYKYNREAIEGLAGALKEYLGIDVVAYPYETCMMKKILKESGINAVDSLYGGHKKDIYKEFSTRAAGCYEHGKCSCS